MVFYFAYGSNMDKDDLDKWCKNRGYPLVRCSSVLPVKLSGYKLTFNYFSPTRQCGAANIVKSKVEHVYGLLLEIEDSALDTIRSKEGYSYDRSKRYYDEIRVDVETFDGMKIKDVFTYKVVRERQTTDHQPPATAYLDLLIRNAVRYGFPRDYINYLKAVPAKD